MIEVIGIYTSEQIKDSDMCEMESNNELDCVDGLMDDFTEWKGDMPPRIHAVTYRILDKNTDIEHAKIYADYVNHALHSNENTLNRKSNLCNSNYYISDSSPFNLITPQENNNTPKWHFSTYSPIDIRLFIYNTLKEIFLGDELVSEYITMWLMSKAATSNGQQKNDHAPSPVLLGSTVINLYGVNNGEIDSRIVRLYDVLSNIVPRIVKVTKYCYFTIYCTVLYIYIYVYVVTLTNVYINNTYFYDIYK
jgi:hypothetical protein